jgi:ABC-type sugar transport system ATPase subunit
MVFQSYALYPHMTVEQNLGFGLRMGGMPRADVATRVNEAARSSIATVSKEGSGGNAIMNQ